LKFSYCSVAIILIDEAKHHVRAGLLLVYGLREDTNDIKTPLIDVAGLVKHRAVGVRNPIDILDVATFRGGDRCPRLKEPATCSNALSPVPRNLHVVFFPFRMWFGTKDICVHIWKMAHVEKILDGARRRNIDPDRPDTNISTVGFEIFRYGKNVCRRLSEA